MNKKKEKKAATKTVRGYIVKEDKPQTFDDEAYSDNDDDQFDFTENYVKKVPLHKTKVLVQTIDADEQLSAMSYIHGKFPFQGQWWHITVEVKVTNDVMYSTGLPSYRLRSDLSIRRQVFNRMINVVINSEKVSSAAMSVEAKVFQSFLQRQLFKDCLPLYRIERLIELLQQCAAKQPSEPQSAAILALIPHLHNSTEMQEINMGIKYPVSMSILPLVHPRTAHSILKCGMNEPRLMEKLELMVVKTPYELAFRSVIKRKTGHVFREASDQNLDHAGLWAGMEQPYKDAVKVYCVLKEHCYCTGDTYMNIHRLNGQTKRYKGFILSKYQDAINYLKANGSAVEEDSRIYLKNLYDSEMNIAKTLSDMISREKHFAFPVDFATSPLNVLTGDNDQRKAAEMIANKAVVVMSGRGGCGKTEVVSRVCKVALDHYYQLMDTEYKNYIRRKVAKQIDESNASKLKNFFSEETSFAENNSSDVADDTADGKLTVVKSELTNGHAEDTIKNVNLSTGNVEGCDYINTGELGCTAHVTDSDTKTCDSATKDKADANHSNAKSKDADIPKESTNNSMKEEPETDHDNPHAVDDLDCSPMSSQSQGDLFDDSSDEEGDFTSVKLKPDDGVLYQVGKEGDDDSMLSDMTSEDWESFNDDVEPEFSIPDPTHKSYILLTAPTAKAAKVLGNRTGFKGFTLHQIMFRYALWMREPEPKSPFPFKDVAILVVDECSLVAVSNLSFLLYILKSHSKLQRVILLGDLQQLPSIEPGNFLIDVYSALSCKGCAVTLRTNHRAEGRLVVENAIRISAQCMPKFDSTKSFTSVQLKDKEHIELERDEAVRKLISTDAFKCDKTSQFVAFRKLDGEMINNICSKVYTGQICIDSHTKRPQFHEGFKICCSKNGTVNVTVLHDPNNEVTDHLAPKIDLLPDQPSSGDVTGVEAESEEQRAKRRMEFITNKIDQYIEKAQAQSDSDEISESKREEIETQIRNDDMSCTQETEMIQSKPKSKSCDMRLCNGELFWIKAIFMEKAIPPKKFDRERWVIESEDGMTISVYRSALMKECRMKPSWCRTIHTFQGSEINHLAYVVGAAGRQNWQHVYTAVTRGKLSVTIIGDEDCLRKAINACCQKRYCALEEKLKELLTVAVIKENREHEMHPFVPLSSQPRVQYVSDDEFDMLIDDQAVWGDDSVSLPADTSRTSKRQKLDHIVTDRQDAEDLFSQMEEFQQTFHNKIHNPQSNDDIKFSSDEEDFHIASNHMDNMDLSLRKTTSAELNDVNCASGCGCHNGSAADCGGCFDKTNCTYGTERGTEDELYVTLTDPFTLTLFYVKFREKFMPAKKISVDEWIEFWLWLGRLSSYASSQKAKRFVKKAFGYLTGYPKHSRLQSFFSICAASCFFHHLPSLAITCHVDTSSVLYNTLNTTQAAACHLKDCPCVEEEPASSVAA